MTEQFKLTKDMVANFIMKRTAHLWANDAKTKNDKIYTTLTGDKQYNYYTNKRKLYNIVNDEKVFYMKIGSVFCSINQKNQLQSFAQKEPRLNLNNIEDIMKYEYGSTFAKLIYDMKYLYNKKLDIKLETLFNKLKVKIRKDNRLRLILSMIKEYDLNLEKMKIEFDRFIKNFDKEKSKTIEIDGHEKDLEKYNKVINEMSEIIGFLHEFKAEHNVIDDEPIVQSI